MDFLNDFGVKPILLIAQIVNFFILLFILKKFLYGPILKILDERKKGIAESLQNAEEIEKRLAATAEEREKELEKAAKEARQILDKATKNATQIISEAHQKAALDIEQMVAKSNTQIKAERERMHDEIRAELADLVVAGLQKVTGKILTGKDQKEMISKSLKGFES